MSVERVRRGWRAIVCGALALLCASTGLHAEEGDEGVESRLNRVEDRLTDLETIMNGPMAHLIGENRQQHASLEERLGAIEQSIRELRAELGRAQGASPAPTTAPLAPLPPVAAPSTPPAPSGPQVHVVLPSERRAAREELPPAPDGTGAFAVVLLSSPNAEATERELQRLQEMGITAEKREIAKDGQPMYRIVVSGFATRALAEGYATNVRQMAELDNKPWVYAE